MIKRKLFAVFMALLVAMLGGCDSDSDSGSNIKELAQEYENYELNIITAPVIMFDKIITALDDRDSDALKSLFSKNALKRTPEIDEQIKELMEFYKGKFVSNNHFDSGASTGIRNEGVWVYLSIRPIIKELKTEEEVYELLFSSVPIDDENPNDVGLWRVWLSIKNDEKTVAEWECKTGVSYPGRENEL